MTNALLYSLLSLVGFQAMALDVESLKPYLPQDVLASVRNYKQDRFYTGQNQTKNYYAQFSVEENIIDTPLIFITGVEDPIPLWYETVHEALQYGYKHVYVIEIRGQGQSQRVPGNEQRAIHVEDFQNYSLDLVAAFEDIHRHTPFSHPVQIVSHSTGSLVVLQSFDPLASRLPSLKISAMALWTPLIRLPVSGLLDNSVIRPVVSWFEQLYAACCGKFLARKYEREEFENNKLTTDKNKFAYSQFLKFDAGLGSSGASLRWALLALEASRDLRKKTLPRFPISTLLLTAGQETVVSNDFSVDNPKIQVEHIPEAKHAIYLERDEIFQRVLTRTFEFLNSHK